MFVLCTMTDAVGVILGRDMMCMKIRMKMV